MLPPRGPARPRKARDRPTADKHDYSCPAWPGVTLSKLFGKQAQRGRSRETAPYPPWVPRWCPYGPGCSSTAPAQPPPALATRVSSEGLGVSSPGRVGKEGVVIGSQDSGPPAKPPSPPRTRRYTCRASLSRGPPGTRVACQAFRTAEEPHSGCPGPASVHQALRSTVPGEPRRAHRCPGDLLPGSQSSRYRTWMWETARGPATTPARARSGEHRGATRHLCSPGRWRSSTQAVSQHRTHRTHRKTPGLPARRKRAWGREAGYRGGACAGFRGERAENINLLRSRSWAHVSPYAASVLLRMSEKVHASDDAQEKTSISEAERERTGLEPRWACGTGDP